MNRILCSFFIAVFLVTGTQSCEIPEMTPEERDRIEREWRRERERDWIEERRNNPEDWRRYIK
jgi:hypothetical protein